jgi:hypothetical protein
MNTLSARVSAAAALENAEQVVAEPLRFKAKLAIGDEAYTSLRVVNRLRELWDVLGAAGTGVAVAKSSLVASSFFAPSGLLGALGIGTAATPIGWVAFAALASGGACYGLYRFLGNSKGSRVVEIPKFLNTPLDALGLALFDLIAPLALRLAKIDGEIEVEERVFLARHLVDDWGLDGQFVLPALMVVEPGLHESSLEDMARELAGFLHTNPDCKHGVIAAELSSFLREMLEAAGPLTPEEEHALSRVSELLLTEPKGALAKAWESARSTIAPTGASIAESATKVADRVQSHMPSRKELLGAAEAANGAIQQGLKRATAAAQAVMPTTDQLKGSIRSVSSVSNSGLERIKQKFKRG